MAVCNRTRGINLAKVVSSKLGALEHNAKHRQEVRIAY